MDSSTKNKNYVIIYLQPVPNTYALLSSVKHKWRFFFVFCISLPVLLHHWAKLENLDQSNFLIIQTGFEWFMNVCQLIY